MTSHANSCPACGQAHAPELSVRGLCSHCLLSLALVDSERDESPTLLREDEPSLDGEILGNRYQVRSLLGRGGMGEVWRAFDLKLRVDVALKAVRGDFLAETTSGGVSPP